MKGALDSRVRSLLAEAAGWRLLGLLFERPARGWAAEVAGLLGGCPEPALREAAEGALREAAEGPYLAVLGPGGTVSPREVGHRETAEPGRLLADIGAFYRAFAYRPAGAEPPDHAAVEAGFLGYLRLKEAYALARGDPRAAAVTAEAAERFRQEHLAAWAETLATALEAAGIPYLARAGQALLRRAGPRPAGADGGWAPRGLGAPGCPFPRGGGPGA